MTNAKNTSRGKEIELIRTFLKNPAHNGGVLLVCGERGSGKTHLVDEALCGCEEDNKSWFSQTIDRLFGDHPLRHKQRIRRKPRNTERHIIPVPVDPFFPHVQTKAPPPKTDKAEDKKTNCPEPEPFDPRTALIKNVIFALTSTLDPRISIRRYGRTLRERLGWWDYWFSKTILRGQNISRLGILLLSLFASLISASTYIYWGDGQSSFNNFTPLIILTLVALGAAIFLIGWLFLRWYDWHSLAQHSGRLYDLVHADEAKQSVHADKLLSMAYSGNTKSIPGTIKAMLLSALASLGLWGASIQPGNTPLLQLPGITPDNPHWLLVAAVALTVAAGLASFTISRRQDWHRDFGTQNPAWRVTLLRRYLFLLHRCGIEPVLVVDELDKLDKQFFQTGQKLGSEEHDRHAEIRQFLTAFARLKQSLGAHFFWILVDEYQILEEILTARHASPQGAAATLVQDIIVIGPICFEDAQNQLSRMVDDQPPMHLPAKHQAYYWITAKGLYAGLRSAYDERHQDMAQVLTKRAKRLQGALHDIWEFQHFSISYFFQYDKTLGIRLADRPFKDLIHSGMLRLAQKLLEFEILGFGSESEDSFMSKLNISREESNRSYGEAFDAPSSRPQLISIIQWGTPHDYVTLGEMFLAAHLLTTEPAYLYLDDNAALKLKPGELPGRYAIDE
jgi:hypothetical protein